MDCHEARRYLSPYLDSSLSPELQYRISQHLDGCAGCRERFEAEQRLEGRLRGALAKPHPSDEAVWNRALSKAIPRRLGWVRWTGVAACLAVLGAGLGWGLRRGHTDLVVSAMTHHEKMLDKLALPPSTSVDAEALNEEFSKSLSFPAAVSTRWPEGARLMDGRTCYLDGVPVAYLFFHVNNMPVSVFIMAREALSSFPEGKRRFQAGGPHFDCDTGKYRVCARDRGDRVTCLVGKPGFDRLEALASALDIP